MVFFQRKGHKGWKGPATVLGREGQVIIVKQGGLIYRVHPCHIQKRSQQKSSRSPQQIDEQEKASCTEKKTTKNENLHDSLKPNLNTD